MPAILPSSSSTGRCRTPASRICDAALRTLSCGPTVTTSVVMISPAVRCSEFAPAARWPMMSRSEIMPTGVPPRRTSKAPISSALRASATSSTVASGGIVATGQTITSSTGLSGRARCAWVYMVSPCRVDSGHSRETMSSNCRSISAWLGVIRGVGSALPSRSYGCLACGRWRRVRLMTHGEARPSRTIEGEHRDAELVHQTRGTHQGQAGSGGPADQAPAEGILHGTGEDVVNTAATKVKSRNAPRKFSAPSRRHAQTSPVPIVTAVRTDQAVPQAWGATGVDDSELLMASRSPQRRRSVRAEGPSAPRRTTLLVRRARPDARESGGRHEQHQHRRRSELDAGCRRGPALGLDQGRQDRLGGHRSPRVRRVRARRPAARS